jgi:DNA polymerase
MKTPLEVLNEDWSECRRCPLGELARHHVLYELSSPESETVDLMIVGEGPGMVENLQGRPFYGRSGRLLRRTLKAIGVQDLTICYTNLLACRPQERRNALKNRTASEEEILACRPRLVGLLEILRPRMVLQLGHLSQNYTVTQDWVEYRGAYHPSHILREGGVETELYKQWVERLKDYIKELRYAKNYPVD